MERPRRGVPWAALAAAAACVVLGAIGVAARERVPLLSLVNLGFHELGHLVTYAFPDAVTAAMGSVAQVAVPAGLAAYFWWGRREGPAAGVCLAWAATSAEEVATYAADAPYRRLPLLGGEHDWAFLLGRWDALGAADELAAAVRILAWVLLLGGLALCAVAARPERPAPEPIPGIRVRPISWDEPAD